MANIGYRTFNGSTDGLAVNIGNIASASSIDCWIFAGRLLSGASDGEVIATTTYDPLDLYFGSGSGQLHLYDGVADTGPASLGLSWTTANGFVIMAIRRVAGATLRYSKAIYSGGAWGAFTHTQSGSAIYTNRTYPSSGILRIAENVALNMDLALLARCTSVTDAEINALTTNLASWSAMTGLTNLWRFDGATVVDLKGTATQNSLTGTSVTANGFPLDAGTSTVTGTAANTQDNQTSSAAGSTVTGSAANVQADQTSSATGSFTSSSITGSAVNVQADQTSSATGSTVTGTAANTQADQTSTASGVSGAYIFDDEFSGASVDTTLWTVYNRLGDQVNNEVNAVIPANARVSSGTLKIDSKFEDVVAGDTTTGAPNPRTVHYTSAQIAQATPSFLYGDVQVRAKLPGGTGLWPCIWMLGYLWQPSQPYTANDPAHNWPNGGWWECDIAEFGLDHRTSVNTQLHFGSNHPGGFQALPYDATTRFMVYRLKWAPGSLIWQVDPEDGSGWQTLLTVTGTPGVDIPNTPGYLIIHTAIGGNFATTPDSSTFPQSMEVDYARIIQTVDSVNNGSAANVQADQTSSGTGTFTPATVTGTAANTQADQTSSATGSTVTGSAANVQADQTSSATGAHGVAGAAATTQDDQTSSATGSFTPAAITGSAASTQDDQTSSASGSTTSGTAANVQDDQVSAASGTFTLATVTGTAANTQDNQTSSAAGSTVTGSAANTQDDQLSTASGTANPPGTAGSAANVQDDQTSSATGTFTPPTVTGTAANVQDDQTSAAAGTASPPGVAGAASITQDDQTSSASGSTVTGTLSILQDNQVSAGTGTASTSTITGVAANVQDDQGSTATGSTVTGTAVTVQDSQTSNATATVIITGTIASTSADQTSNAVGMFGVPIAYPTIGVYTWAMPDSHIEWAMPDSHIEWSQS